MATAHCPVIELDSESLSSRSWRPVLARPFHEVLRSLTDQSCTRWPGQGSSGTSLVPCERNLSCPKRRFHKGAKLHFCREKNEILKEISFISMQSVIRGSNTLFFTIGVSSRSRKFDVAVIKLGSNLKMLKLNYYKNDAR